MKYGLPDNYGQNYQLNNYAQTCKRCIIYGLSSTSKEIIVSFCFVLVSYQHEEVPTCFKIETCFSYFGVGTYVFLWELWFLFFLSNLCRSIYGCIEETIAYWAFSILYLFQCKSCIKLRTMI